MFSDFMFFDSIEDVMRLKGRCEEIELRSLRSEDSENPSYYVEEICFQIVDCQNYELFEDRITANLLAREDRLKRIQLGIEFKKMKKKLLRIAKCRWKIHIRSIFGKCLRENEFMLNYARHYMMCANMMSVMYNYNLFTSSELGVAYPIRLACYSISLVLGFV